jgi:hypothetical protein
MACGRTDAVLMAPRSKGTSIFQKGLCLPMAPDCQLEEAETSVRRRFLGS